MANLQNAKDFGKGIVDESEIQSKVETFSPPTDLTPYSTTAQINTLLADKEDALPRQSSAPTGASAGDRYYNTSDGFLYVYNGSDWRPTNFAPFSAEGGNSTYTSGGYKYHVFTSSGTLTVYGTESKAVEYLIVAGGGSGGRTDAGGGGAGGCLTGTAYPSQGDVSITIGGGGATETVEWTRGNSGSGSSISGPSFNVSCVGGGGGASGASASTTNRTPLSGGSGGGGGSGGSSYRGAPTSGQGNYGGYGNSSNGGGGGGGKGSAGSNGPYGAAGNGISWNGYNVAGGGNGGHGSAAYGTTTYGGGSAQNAGNGGNASANTGSGGGGGGGSHGTGGAGGSGIVVVRYAI